MAMSEVQVNGVLSSQSTESVDSIQQSNSVDSNGEPVMSKSKARSLRRKRAKQRKKEAMNGASQGENKSESQDKENNGASASEENQASKKKKQRKKKTNKDVVTEENKAPKVQTEVATSTPEVTPQPVDESLKAECKSGPPPQISPSKSDFEKTAVYEDDNASENGKKEDCACACVIS